MNNNIFNSNVTIINPPYETGNKAMARWRKAWKHGIRIMGIYFYVSNVSLKKRGRRDLSYNTAHHAENIIKNKQKLYERQEHRCPLCGEEFTYKEMELHHILPWARFPELKQSIRNSVMLCRHCHKEVHCNPWRNIQMMQEKAQELGLNLKERYEGAQH
jgi:hypothetical protein